jgi:hypothetical protein
MVAEGAARAASMVAAGAVGAASVVAAGTVRVASVVVRTHHNLVGSILASSNHDFAEASDLIGLY